MKKLFKKRFVRFCIFGMIGGTIEIFLFWLYYEHFNINYIVSNVVSFFVSVLFLFYANNKYVYKSSIINNKKKKNKLAIFIVTRIFALLVDTLVLYFCLYTIGIGSIVSKLVSCISTTFINYYIGKYIFS